jgi:hypothetical protein
MQIVRPHLPRLDATYTLDGSLSQADPDGGERRYYVAAEEVEFRWLVGKWLLGQRRLVEVHLGSVYEVKGRLRKRKRKDDLISSSPLCTGSQRVQPGIRVMPE